MKVNLTPEVKHKILYVLIALVLLLIVVASAIAVAIIRAQYAQLPEGEVVEPVVVEELDAYEKARAMHVEGDANPTADEISRMEAMNAQASEATAEEFERMQRMYDTSAE